jgi:hypothetical protein
MNIVEHILRVSPKRVIDKYDQHKKERRERERMFVPLPFNM